ncbi:unnamed protein product [Kluyveromyces dobzhanskii CBS 2104]|uniref:WGS project CCBQ000000000 data, contig 00008 n=1 Tax=Kluyveromyces dobzhanskii CBS 2104 TaxID=1427455 RepID=A0A0A8L9R2_9SACH|nr:unnamed protein product [Kluyveromyces dobzhanskii CBS 2104]
MTSSIVKTEDISSVSSKGDSSQSPEEVEESLRLIEDLKFFLATAPANWQENQVIRRYYLSNDEGFVSCVFWNNLYYITGTDIVRCCAYRMQKYGREIVERKKFEEGIFSDLRNLKCGIDATLEKPKSDFLAFLYKNMCLKTQKKQKVFFWFSVPHDRLFADALERDLKRSSTGSQPTTRAICEPAMSFHWEANSKISLYDQILNHADAQRGDSRPVTVEEKPVIQQQQQQQQNQQKHHIADTPVSATKDVEVPQSNGVEEEEAQVEPNHKIPYGLPPPEATNYEPQQLVISQSDLEGDELCGGFDELNADLKPSDILTSNKEDDDFPLDYFPVEIEYSQTSMDSSLHMVPQGAKGPNQMMFYEDMDGMLPGSKYPISAGIYEDPFFRDEMVASNSSKYMMPPPISATRAHFMTNAEYYNKTKEGKRYPKQSRQQGREDGRREYTNEGEGASDSPSDNENDNEGQNNAEAGQVPDVDRQPDIYQASDAMANEEYVSAYNRRMHMNESLVHPYTGMMMNPYMFCNMLAVDPSVNMGVNPMVDPFYGQSHAMDTMHDVYSPQEVVYPSNYRTTPKAAFFNMRSPYGRNFPPPSAMNPYYTPYHRRQPSSESRRYYNKANIINRKSKSPPRKNMVSKPSHKASNNHNKLRRDTVNLNLSGKESGNSSSESRDDSAKDDSNESIM